MDNEQWYDLVEIEKETEDELAVTIDVRSDSGNTEQTPEDRSKPRNARFVYHYNITYVRSFVRSFRLFVYLSVSPERVYHQPQRTNRLSWRGGGGGRRTKTRLGRRGSTERLQDSKRNEIK